MMRAHRTTLLGSYQLVHSDDWQSKSLTATEVVDSNSGGGGASGGSSAAANNRNRNHNRK